MLQISLAVLIVIAGGTAADICDEPDITVCKKMINQGDPPRRFPETEEELHPFCDFAVPYFECRLVYAVKCGRSEGLQTNRNILRITKKMCDESTRFHGVMVDNIKCFSDFNKEYHTYECKNEPTEFQLTTYFEELINKGILTPTDDKYENCYRKQCVRTWREIACYATNMERKCGTDAMDAYLEFLREFRAVPECGASGDAVTASIPLYKMEEEEENVMISLTLTLMIDDSFDDYSDDDDSFDDYSGDDDFFDDYFDDDD